MWVERKIVRAGRQSGRLWAGTDCTREEREKREKKNAGDCVPNKYVCGVCERGGEIDNWCFLPIQAIKKNRMAGMLEIRRFCEVFRIKIKKKIDKREIYYSIHLFTECGRISNKQKNT